MTYRRWLPDEAKYVVENCKLPPRDAPLTEEEADNFASYVWELWNQDNFRAERNFKISDDLQIWFRRRLNRLGPPDGKRLS